MKLKLFKIIFFSFVFISPLVSFGNALGFPIDTIGYKQLTVSASGVYGERDLTEKQTRLIHKTKQTGFAVKGVYGFMDKGDFILQLGAGKLDIPDQSFNGSLGFEFGVGLKATLYESPIGWNFTATGLYSRFSTDDGNVNLARSETIAGLSVSQKMAFFKPYIGVMLTQARVFKDLVYESETHIGLLLGLEYKFLPELTGNVEAHLVNETVLRAGLSYKFGNIIP